MKVFFLFILSYIFSGSVFATTLVEIGAAPGIANTIQNTGSFQKGQMLDKVKEQIKEYEKAKHSQFKNLESANPQPASSNISNPDSHSVLTSEELRPDIRTLTKEEVAERLRDKEIRQKDISVNYKKSVQVFYKKKCQPSQKKL